MRPSPLQLRHVIYKRVSIVPHIAEGDSKLSTFDFSFEGVSIRSKIGTSLKQGQEADPRDFLVDLDIVIDNKQGKLTPYNIDVGVIGVFNVLPSLPKERREDLVTVNGASILYGTIREMVLSITSRFAAGALTLPGMNFEDSVSSARRIQEAKKAPAVESANQSKSGKKSKKQS